MTPKNIHILIIFLQCDSKHYIMSPLKGANEFIFPAIPLILLQQEIINLNLFISSCSDIDANILAAVIL